MPERYRRYEKEPWKSRGLRVLLVDNYVVFYIPDSDKKVVTILRVMYAGRDTDNQLNLYTKQRWDSSGMSLKRYRLPTSQNLVCNWDRPIYYSEDFSWLHVHVVVHVWKGWEWYLSGEFHQQTLNS